MREDLTKKEKKKVKRINLKKHFSLLKRACSLKKKHATVHNQIVSLRKARHLRHWVALARRKVKLGVKREELSGQAQGQLRLKYWKLWLEALRN